MVRLCVPNYKSYPKCAAQPEIYSPYSSSVIACVLVPRTTHTNAGKKAFRQLAEKGERVNAVESCVSARGDVCVYGSALGLRAAKVLAAQFTSRSRDGAIYLR